MDNSERNTSFAAAIAKNPIQETPAQKRIRDLAAKANTGTLTNPEMQEALKLLLNVRAADISRTRKPLT